MEAEYRCPVASAKDGGKVLMALFPASSGLASKEGEWVTLDGNKRLVAAGSDPTNVIGILNQDASGEEDEMLRVILAVPENIFIMNVRFDGDGDADDQTAQNMVTKDFGLYIDGTTKRSYVDTSDEAQTVFKVLAIDSEFDVGTVYGKVQVQVLAAKSILE